MAGHNVNVCDIGDDVKEKLKKFRFSKHNENCALIVKVNREKQALEVEDEIENVDLEELQNILPSHQPRFIIYRLQAHVELLIDTPMDLLETYVHGYHICYKMEHDDGRTSFPMCFIFYTPRDAHMELQVMYAGTQRALAAAAGAARLLEARELDELSAAWLREKLCR